MTNNVHIGRLQQLFNKFIANIPSLIVGFPVCKLIVSKSINLLNIYCVNSLCPPVIWNYVNLLSRLHF